VVPSEIVAISNPILSEFEVSAAHTYFSAANRLGLHPVGDGLKSAAGK
jgi:hypothetical protein